MNFTRTYKAIIILTLITTSGILFSVDSQKSVKTSGVPENLTISQNGDSMTIVWNRVESATGYKIYGMLNPEDTPQLLGNTADTVWTATYSGSRHFFVVTASFQAGGIVHSYGSSILPNGNPGTENSLVEYRNLTLNKNIGTTNIGSSGEYYIKCDFADSKGEKLSYNIQVGQYPILWTQS
jgi:hypothetical protein